jgi:hypothetical protein
VAMMLYEFTGFPREREIVGQLLIAYGEIEYALLGCLRNVLDDDIHTATRILFRVQGESARIEVSDAIMRPAFTKVGLGHKWGNAIGAARICKNIRNQYAHCHWHLQNGNLNFLNLDVVSRSPEGPIGVAFIKLDISLLEEQLTYYEYALDWLYYLAKEYQKQVGRLTSHDLSEPKSLHAPLLHIPRE